MSHPKCVDCPISNCIKKDHQHLNDLVHKIQNEKNLECKKKQTWCLIREMCHHSYQEQEVLHPALLKYLKEGQGKQWYDKSVGEHDELEKVLDALDGIDGDPRNDKYNTYFDSVVKLHQHHIQQEEKDVLPLLEAAAQMDTLKKLGADYCNARASAPTRPHPSAPKNAVALSALRVADVLKDKSRFKDDGTCV